MQRQLLPKRFHVSNEGPGSFFVDSVLAKSGHVRRWVHGNAIQDRVHHLAFRQIGIKVLLRFAAMTPEALVPVESDLIERLLIAVRLRQPRDESRKDEQRQDANRDSDFHGRK